MVFLSGTHNINDRMHFIKQKSLHRQEGEGSGALGKMSVAGDGCRTGGAGTTLTTVKIFTKKTKCHSCHVPIIVIKNLVS